MRKRQSRPALPLRDLDHHGKANYIHLLMTGARHLAAENRL
jgi:hypothetical protein